MSLHLHQDDTTNMSHLQADNSITFSLSSPSDLDLVKCRIIQIVVCVNTGISYFSLTLRYFILLYYYMLQQNYDFNYQIIQNFETPVILSKGEQIRSHCVYDTTANEKTVYGGDATYEEMCLTFFVYYPKVCTCINL